MPVDYVILAAIAALGVVGGVFLLFQAKNYRSPPSRRSKSLPHQRPIKTDPKPTPGSSAARGVFLCVREGNSFRTLPLWKDF